MVLSLRRLPANRFRRTVVAVAAVLLLTPPAVAQADDHGQPTAGQPAGVEVAAPKVLYYDDLPAAPAGRVAFVLDAGTWTSMPVTWSFTAASTNDLTLDTQRNAVRQAVQLWNSAGSRLRLQEVASSLGTILISFGSFNHGDGFPFDNQNGVLAHAFSPPPTHTGAIAGDVHFDDSETWSANQQSTGVQPIDLVTVAAHEIGHAIGLRHSGVAGALMAPQYTGSHRFLSADDIAGVRAKYP